MLPVRSHVRYALAVLAVALLAGCASGSPETDGEGDRDATSPPSRAGATDTSGKMALWDNASGPHLRGANIWQARVFPELDGPDFKGPGPVGPPFRQEDFDRLAEWGANYVNISHPGLFTVDEPYELDEGVQDNLDRLLDMAAEADLFAVISFRTGPGRSEFGFFVDDRDDPVYGDYMNDSMWEDSAAQDGWVEMWRYTAERYRDNPIVAGYDLMVEPNSAGIFFDMYEPEEFYPDRAGSLYDWNQLHPRLTEAVREVDPDTPILIGAMGHSAVLWLPALQPAGDPRTVYMVHQYEPIDYTHQEPPLEATYPGELDLDYDGEADAFDREWLDEVLATVDTFRSTHGVPVATNEFGPMRWQPGAAAYVDDQVGLFEQRGMNHAIWAWAPAWAAFTEEVNDFNIRFGPDPDSTSDVESSELVEVIKEYWSRNTVRPSTFGD